MEERIILYRMLTEAWGNLGPNARRVFLGGLSSVTRFMEYESWCPSREIDGSIVEQFRSAVKGPGAELHREFIRVRDLLAQGQDDQAWRKRQRPRAASWHSACSSTRIATPRCAHCSCQQRRTRCTRSVTSPMTTTTETSYRRYASWRDPMALWSRSRRHCVSFALSCHWLLQAGRLALTRPRGCLSTATRFRTNYGV